MAVDLGLHAGVDVDADQSDAVAALVGADPDAGAVRGDLGGGDAHRIVNAGVAGDGAQCPGSLVPAGQFHIAVGGHGRVEQFAVAAAQPLHDIAGIFREQREIAGGDVQFVRIEQFGIALVELDDGLARPPLGQREHGPHPGERGEIDGRGARGIEVDAVDVPVLVAAAVLQVQQPPRIVGPVIDVHAACRVGGDTAGVVRQIACCTDALHPDVQAVVAPRRQVGDAVAVRRYRREEPLGWAEEVLHRDQFGHRHVSPFG